MVLGFDWGFLSRSTRSTGLGSWRRSCTTSTRPSDSPRRTRTRPRGPPAQIAERLPIRVEFEKRVYTLRILWERKDMRRRIGVKGTEIC